MANGTMFFVATTDKQKILRIKEKYTLRNIYTNTAVKLYEEAEGGIYIPRGHHKNPWELPLYEGRHIGCEFTSTLTDEQEKLAESYFGHVQNAANNNGGIIQAGTGVGKTVVAIKLMTMIDHPTLIIVPTVHLMEQWRERLLQHTNLMHRDIGEIRQDRCDHDKSVVIALIHSVSKKGRYPEEIFDNFGLTIWDEVHKLGAPTFSESAKFIGPYLRMGLSATPKRKDGLENAFIYHIGNIIEYKVPQKIIPTIAVLPFKGKGTSHTRYVFKDKFHIPLYLNHICGLEERNLLIADTIYKAFKKDRNILVLTDRIDQITALKNMLERKYKIALSDIGIFSGSSKYGLDRKIILATYGCAGLGADIPRLDTLLLASPRVEVEQAVGRILRGTTEKTPVVVDILDIGSTMMVRWFAVRKRFYDKIGAKVHR